MGLRSFIFRSDLLSKAGPLLAFGLLPAFYAFGDEAAPEAYRDPVKLRADNCRDYLESLVEYSPFESAEDLRKIDGLISRLKSVPETQVSPDLIIADEVISFLTTTRFEDATSLEKLSGALGQLSFSASTVDPDVLRLNERIYLSLRGWLLKSSRKPHEIKQISYFMTDLTESLIESSDFWEDELYSLVSELPNSNALDLLGMWLKAFGKKAGTGASNKNQSWRIFLDVALSAATKERGQLDQDADLFEKNALSFFKRLMLDSFSADEPSGKVNIRAELEKLPSQAWRLGPSDYEGLTLLNIRQSQLDYRYRRSGVFIESWQAIFRRSLSGYSNTSFDEQALRSWVQVWILIESRWNKFGELNEWVERVRDSLEKRLLSPEAKVFMLQKVQEAFSARVMRELRALFLDSASLVGAVKYLELKQVLISKLMTHAEGLERSLEALSSFESVAASVHASQVGEFDASKWDTGPGDDSKLGLENADIEDILQDFLSIDAQELEREIDREKSTSDPEIYRPTLSSDMPKVTNRLRTELAFSPIRRFAFLYDEDFPQFKSRYSALREFELRGGEFSDLSSEELQLFQADPASFQSKVGPEKRWELLSEEDFDALIESAQIELEGFGSANRSLSLSFKLLELAGYLKNKSESLRAKLYQSKTKKPEAYRAFLQLRRLYKMQWHLLDLLENLISKDLTEASVHQSIAWNLINARTVALAISIEKDLLLYSSMSSEEAFEQRWMALRAFYLKGFSTSALSYEVLEHYGQLDDDQLLSFVSRMTGTPSP